MEQAIASVKSGAMSKRKATEIYGVPKTTLLYKLSGRSQEERVRPGPAMVLSLTEELVLCDNIKLLASTRYPFIRGKFPTEVQ